MICRYRTWPILTAATLLLCACTTTVPGSGSLREPLQRPEAVIASTTPAPAGIAVADAPHVLLGADQLKSLVGAGGLKLDQSSPALTDPDPGTDYEPPECMGVLYNGKAPSYTGTNPVGAYGESFSDTDVATAHGVSEMIVVFDSAQAAHAAVQHLVDGWNACRGRTIGGTRGDGQSMGQWTISDITTTDGVTTLIRRPDNSLGWSCARFVAAKANIVVDGLLCSYDIADRPAQIASAIIGGVPG